MCVEWSECLCLALSWAGVRIHLGLGSQRQHRYHRWLQRYKTKLKCWPCTDQICCILKDSSGLGGHKAGHREVLSFFFLWTVCKTICHEASQFWIRTYVRFLCHNFLIFCPTLVFPLWNRIFYYFFMVNLTNLSAPSVLWDMRECKPLFKIVFGSNIEKSGKKGLKI